MFQTGSTIGIVFGVESRDEHLWGPSGDRVAVHCVVVLTWWAVFPLTKLCWKRVLTLSVNRVGPRRRPPNWFPQPSPLVPSVPQVSTTHPNSQISKIVWGLCEFSLSEFSFSEFSLSESSFSKHSSSNLALSMFALAILALTNWALANWALAKRIEL